MEKLDGLNVKFNNINAKINAVFIKINENYEVNAQKIKNQENFLEKIINDYRQSLLDKLKEKRDTQLENSSINQTIDSIKSEYLLFQTFNVLNEAIYKNIYKFKPIFDLLQLMKYSKLIINKKSIQLKLPISEYNFDSKPEKCIFILPTNELFIPLYQKTKHNKILEKMVLIHKDGSLKVSLKFNKIPNNLYTHSFAVNTSNIFHSYTVVNKLFEYTIIKIYNFDLKEVYENKFMDSRFSSLISNNYELYSGSNAYSEKRKFLIFNFLNLNSNFMNYQTEEPNKPFYLSPYAQILHVNDELIYYTDEKSCLIFFNRSNGTKIGEIKLNKKKDDLNSVIVKFDEQSRIYIYEDLIKNSDISVYDSYGKHLFNLKFNPIFKSLCLSSKSSYIYNQAITATKIEYHEF